MNNTIDMSGLAADPYQFFSTAAGPNEADIYGPPQNALDLYANGAPVSAAESATANAMTGGGGCPWWRRPDLHSVVLILAGALMIHLHREA